eukprot:scaffold42592_cov72-Phaeocystis_antarctica.AAC.5
MLVRSHSSELCRSAVPRRAWSARTAHTFTCTLTPHAARDYRVRFISLLCVCPRVDPDMPCSHDVTSSATISASSKAYKLTDHRTRLRVAL